MLGMPSNRGTYEIRISDPQRLVELDVERPRMTASEHGESTYKKRKL
jgi:hypothetical protein